MSIASPFKSVKRGAALKCESLRALIFQLWNIEIDLNYRLSIETYY